jgi:hypothetical protein
MPTIVLYDACVLYAAPLRDLLMQLALTDLYQARWTEQIHEEWIRNVLANHPEIQPASLARCRQLMNEHVADCLVEGYEALIPTLELPDPDDRHVLAAAIHAEAQVVLTFNLSDFPSQVLKQYHIEAVHPDRFVTRLLDQYSDSVFEAMRLHRLSLKNPKKTAVEYLATLERCQLPLAAERVRQHEDAI